MLPERIFSSFQTAAQGLSVQRKKIAAATNNIANAGTTAPKASAQVFRPQTVQTDTGNRQDFQGTLLNSISTLQRNRPEHISPNASSGNPGSIRSNLGPTAGIVETDSFRYEFDPDHPDADENGMVRYPDVDLIREMTQLVSANRLYEANLSAIEAEKQIIKRSLEI